MSIGEVCEPPRAAADGDIESVTFYNRLEFAHLRRADRDGLDRGCRSKTRSTPAIFFRALRAEEYERIRSCRADGRRVGAWRIRLAA